MWGGAVSPDYPRRRDLQIWHPMIGRLLLSEALEVIGPKPLGRLDRLP